MKTGEPATYRVGSNKKEGNKMKVLKRIVKSGKNDFKRRSGGMMSDCKSGQDSTRTHHTGQFFARLGQREGAWGPLSLWEGRVHPHSQEKARMNHLP